MKGSIVYVIVSNGHVGFVCKTEEECEEEARKIAQAVALAVRELRATLDSENSP